MPHVTGKDFVKKSRERAIAKSADIFVARPSSESHSPHSVYLPETAQPQTIDSKRPETTLQPPMSTPVALKQRMTRNEKLKFLLMRSLGNFLVLLSLYGVAATFGPALYFEVQYRVATARGVQFRVQDPVGRFTPVSSTPANAGPGFGDIIAGAKEQVLIPPDPRFSLVIPKIAATAKVWPNVDPLDEKDFLPKLQTGVAHAKGTVFPGMQGNVYLFAHSTDNFWDVGRYNAVFYLLKDLKPGDDVIVYFEDRRYNYKVNHSVVKDPSDVDLLVKSQVPGKEQLILQTCWPPGTTWKRLFVIASPEKSNN